MCKFPIFFLLKSIFFGVGTYTFQNSQFVLILLLLIANLISPIKGMTQPPIQVNLEEEIHIKKDNSVMVLIPEGDFMYGIKEEDRNRILIELSTANFDIFKFEHPEQKKYLSNYYIDKFEVTNTQYLKFVEKTDHKKPSLWNSKVFNKPNQPVIGIGWTDADKYCKWVGKRLPTEEEWEKAARGTDGRIWPWGNKPSSEKYNGKRQGNNAPVKVGSYKSGASPYGVMDMAGNVYEMTTGTWNGDSKAMRGGSFLNAGALTRTMFRWAAKDQKNGARWLGFRCVKEVL